MSRDDMRARARQKALESKGRGAGGLSTIMLPEGMTLLDMAISKVDITKRLDFLPFRLGATLEMKPKSPPHPEVRTGFKKLGELWYELSYLRHRGVGPAADDFICPITFGAACPLDEEFNVARKNRKLSDEEYKALAKELRASERQMFYVIDLDEPDKGVQLFDISYFNFGKLLDKELSAQDEAEPFFANLEDGLTVVVRFSPATIGDGNPFPQATRIDFKPRRRPYPASVVDELSDLVTLLKVSTYEQIEAAWKATPPPAADEPNKDDDGADLTSAGPTRRRAVAQPPVEEEVGVDAGGVAEVGVDSPSPCAACKGTGKNTKGKVCPICWGTKIQPEDDNGRGADAGEPAAGEQPPPAPRRTATRAPAAPPAAPKDDFGDWGEDEPAAPAAAKQRRVRGG